MNKAPFADFAAAIEKMENPKDEYRIGNEVFKEGDTVLGTWVDHQGRTYGQDGKIIRNEKTGLWVQSQPDGGITDIKRFVFLNHIDENGQIKTQPSPQPAEGEAPQDWPIDYKAAWEVADKERLALQSQLQEAQATISDLREDLELYRKTQADNEAYMMEQADEIKRLREALTEGYKELEFHNWHLSKTGLAVAQALNSQKETK